MSETAPDREAIETSAYYAMLDIVGEATAEQVMACDGFWEMAQELDARHKADHDADDLYAFLFDKVQELLAGEAN